MKLEKNLAKRCGIFLFFDKNGYVDDYIAEILKDLKKNLEYLLIVCNGYVDNEGRKVFSSLADDVIYRANVGLDVGGYREGLFFIGFNKLSHFDEIIMLNYTFFGPIYPFSMMFESMASRDVDFWGITTHHALKREENPVQGICYGYMPEHIQSHFLVLRKSLFLSYYYKDFIFNMKNPRTYNESVAGYEIIFTKYFEDLGFKWYSYCCSDQYKDYVNHPIMFKSLEMIRDLKCPIIKRRAFFTEYGDSLVNSCGETTVEAYKFIKEQTEYNTDYIWDNILRVENLRNIHQQMHFNYILSEKEIKMHLLKKTIIFVVIDENFKEYAELLDVSIENIKMETVKISDFNYYSDLLEFMIDQASGEYTYFGVLDLVLTDTNGFSLRENFVLKKAGVENLFSSLNLIEDILENLEIDSKLGMLLSPKTLTNSFVKKFSDGWLGKYENVKRFFEENKWNININKSMDPIVSYNGSFWSKVDLLSLNINEIKNLKGYDKETILLILPLLFQKNLFYSGVAYSELCVETEITDQTFMLRENNKILFRKYPAGYFHEVLNQLK